jgi:hypothetical protein
MAEEGVSEHLRTLSDADLESLTLRTFWCRAVTPGRLPEKRWWVVPAAWPKERKPPGDGFPSRTAAANAFVAALARGLEIDVEEFFVRLDEAHELIRRAQEVAA